MIDTPNTRQSAMNRASYPIILEISIVSDTSIKDWLIGPQRNDIIHWYCNENGLLPEELIVKEIPKSDWESIQIIDPEIVYNEDLDEDNDDYNVIGNFAKSAQEWTGGVELLASNTF